MAIKNILLKQILLIFLLAANFPCVWAQDTTASSARLTQRFSWSGGENALRYEVVFERIENGVNIFHLRQFTTNRFIEVNLPAGEYRFRVIPYDVLDKPAQGTDWRYIEILKMPVTIATPGLDGEMEADIEYEIAEEETLPLIEPGIGFLPVPVPVPVSKPEPTVKSSRYEVVDIPMTWEEAKLEAEKRGGHLATITSAEEQKIIENLIKNNGKLHSYWIGSQFVGNQFEWITGESFEYNNWVSAWWAPDRPKPIDGSKIYITVHKSYPNNFGKWNFDNVNTSIYGFIIEYPAVEGVIVETEPEEEKPWNYVEKLSDRLVSFSTPFSFILPYYGYEFDNFTSGGFGMVVSVTNLTSSGIYVGPEFAVNVYIGDDLFLMAGVNLLAVKWLPNERAAIGVKVGVIYPLWVCNIGASFHYRLLNRVVLEAGVDFLHIFNDVSSGAIRPWVGMGYHF